MNIEGNSLTFVVPEECVGFRADKALATLSDGYSRSRLKGLIEEGVVFLNGAVLKSLSLKVCEGDVFMLNIPEPTAAEPEPEDISLNVVYEDDDLLVIDKQAGLVVHPGAGNWTGTLVNALLHHCGDSLSGIGGVLRPGIVHRLDKDTSGLMIVAKNDHAHQHLSAQLADRTLSRIYHALVVGVPMPMKAMIDQNIARDKRNRLKMQVVRGGGRDARTHYHILERFGESFSLVECKLDTGRTHQIRVHMHFIGCPIVADPLYGAPSTKIMRNIKNISEGNVLEEKIYNIGRQFLHAKALSFVHPVSEETMEFQSTMPKTLEDVLSEMRKWTS